jgi:putative acetyltransferase
MSLTLTIREDDLTGAKSRALVIRHLSGMHANSPADSVHALGIEALRAPNMTFWTAWHGEEVVACGALKRLDDANGEIKSMRVADAWLGKGCGRAMLEHIFSHARTSGIKSLWLETGSGDAFVPAHRLYTSAGFTFCGPFGDYKPDPFSRFMTRAV